MSAIYFEELYWLLMNAKLEWHQLIVPATDVNGEYPIVTNDVCNGC